MFYLTHQTTLAMTKFGTLKLKAKWGKDSTLVLMILPSANSKSNVMKTHHNLIQPFNYGTLKNPSVHR